MNFETFAEGYAQALIGVERAIEASINRNGGARTAEQCVAVLNETIHYLHQEKLTLSDVEEEEVPVHYSFNNVEDVIEALLTDLKNHITQGGRF